MTNAGTPPLLAEPRPKGMLYRLLRAITPLRAALRFGREHLARYRLQVWRLEGRERASGAPLVILFAGQLENKNYIAHLAFAGTPEESSAGAVWLWSVRWRAVRDGADLAIRQVDRLYYPVFARGGGRFIPCWVGLEADLADATARLNTSDTIRSDRRRIRKHDLQYEVTRDPALYEDFYRRMYLPTVLNHHADRSMPVPWSELEAEIGRTVLLLVKKDGEYIGGGSFCDMGGGRARARLVGVKDGDEQYVRMGAMAATYIFGIEHLAAAGCRSVHYGGTRGFLQDGLLQYKKKYGVRIVNADTRGFQIMATGCSTAVESFLVNNPYIAEEMNGSFFADIFVRAGKDSDAGALKARLTKLYVPGVAAIRLHVFGQPPEPAALDLDFDVPVVVRASVPGTIGDDVAGRFADDPLHL